jgi:hypothetical protein
MSKRRPTPPTLRSALTPAQTWYLDALRRWIAHFGTPPTLLELATWLERTTSPVYSALVALEGKGYVARAGGDERLDKRDRRFVPVDGAG